MPGELPLLWQFWVAGLTLIGLLFLAILVWRIYFPEDQDRESDAERVGAQVVWDETLTESTAVPPKWWFWLITVTLLYSVLYLIAYPGLSNYNGLFDLSTATRYSESRERLHNRHAADLAEWEAMDGAQLRQSPAAMKLAANLFENHCANCHGADAAGQASLFPNLRDAEWQWGGAEAQIIHTITHGRNAVMPPWETALGGETGVAKMAALVQNFAANRDAPAHQEAYTQYQQLCTACHGAGAGNPTLGAPNLTNNIWLYGNDPANLKQSIAKGRNGIMPPQNTRLTPLQIKLLAAWLVRP